MANFEDELKKLKDPTEGLTPDFSFLPNSSPATQSPVLDPEIMAKVRPPTPDSGVSFKSLIDYIKAGPADADKAPLNLFQNEGERQEYLNQLRKKSAPKVDLAIPPTLPQATEPTAIPAPVIQRAVPKGVPTKSAIREPAIIPAGDPATEPKKSVQDYIAERISSQQEGLKEAQAQANAKRGRAGLLEGLGQIASSATGANNFNPNNYSYLHSEANQPVSDYLQQTKQATEAMGDISNETKLQRDLRLDDPASVSAKISQRMMGQRLQKLGVNPKSIEGLNSVELADLEKTLQHEGDSQYKERMAKVAEREAGVKELTAKAKAGGGTVQERVGKLSGEQKKRLDSEVMGFGAIQDMMKAYDNGDNTFSLVGDNDYTFAKNRFIEALGRLQSGGAISKEELKSFGKMVPSAADTKDIQTKKLNEMQKEFKRRLGATGFAPQEFGIQEYGFGKGSKKPSQGRVRVISPDGKPGSVPESQLEEVLNRGYTKG